MAGIGRAAARRRACACRSPRPRPRTMRSAQPPEPSAHARPEILAANARDMAAAKANGAASAFLDRLRLDPARVAAMAKGLEDIAALPDPVGTTARAVRAAEWASDRARRDAARRHRRHLRKPPGGDGGRRRALPQGRQCGDPARRLGKLFFGRAASMTVSSQDFARLACPPPRSACVPVADRAAVGEMLTGLTAPST